MIYVKDITTSADTAKADALPVILKVTKGLVYKVEVDFPPGAAGLHHVVICDGTYQVWPSEAHTTFHADGVTISFDDTYLKVSEPFEFVIYTYNLDDTFDHFVQVRIGLVSQRAFMARFLPTYAYQEFKEVLQGLAEEQEAARMAILLEPFPWLKEE